MSSALLDVNALVALAWDSHIHHAAVRSWFAARCRDGWATCPLTENGFVRISANPRILPYPVSVSAAQWVLTGIRSAPGHSFLTDDVSIVAADLPRLSGHRQITDAHLLTLARRRGCRVLTFDHGLAALAQGHDVELLTVL
jgi:toxin-antitoxin system PIN domain toxin